MKLPRNSSTILILHVALTLALVHAQNDQSGFISIDCGITRGSNYTDTKTGLTYVSEAGFIDDRGTSQKIQSTYNSAALDLQLTTLTSFPQTTRNCYTLKPKQGKGNKYLIRARFNYGNYDLKGQPPQFDLYLGSDLWYTITFTKSLAVDYEIIHVPSSDYVHVCLVNVGLGIPFISALELRLLDSTMYPSGFKSLILYERDNFGASKTVRYGDDKYDRIWYTIPSPDYIDVQTSDIVSSGSLTTEDVPSKVMTTAITTASPTDSIYYTWSTVNASDMFYMYIHVAEIETLKANQTREFNVYLNGHYWSGPVSPIDHTINTVSSNFYNVSSYEIKLNKTQKSTLPPIINAIELYIAKQLLQWQTDDQDATAIWSIKSTYGIERNWQGDPCVPQTSVWEGLNCSYDDKSTPRIISMNLSSSGLSGDIADALANLTMIRSLDLSYNNLTGTVPEFLAQLDFLKTLNLTGNHFTRPLPAGLLDKSKNGSLLLSIEEASSDADTISCPKGSCKSNKHNKVVIPIISTFSALFVILTILGILWIIRRRRQTQGRVARDELIEPRNQRFTLSEVQKITNNFSSVIGKGGFGTVFHGSIGKNQVAVKMLSESSAQGYKEFQAEVSLLMSVHHKNITSLVGYCNEDNHKGIIYEYLANESLEKHVLDKSPKVLSWEERIQIGYDAAQVMWTLILGQSEYFLGCVRSNRFRVTGLEYMHHGCKPPIVHRDVKCSNILLNDKFQAKLADFGLSRAFTSEGATHVSTVIAGTPGYLDPEYYTTNRLTEKSDVYSFGVVLLELITGRPAISKETYIVNWVESMVAEGRIESIIDPRLHGDFDINKAWKVVELAMNCVARTSVERPTMNDVVTDLKNCLKKEKAYRGAKPNNLNGEMSLSLGNRIIKQTKDFSLISLAAEMKTFRNFPTILILHVVLTLAMVHAQDDQSGFISIDCGITQGSNYTDSKTGLNYVSEAGFIDSGVSRKIQPTYNSTTLAFQLTTLTSFPQDTRNCYTLKPKQGKGKKYLIRARFYYGNYDLKGQTPQFDLYLGSDLWSRVYFTRLLATDREIIHLTSSDYIHVCLVNIGLGTPFISALELRLLDSTMYPTQFKSLILSARINFGASETVRYGDDKYDRIWYNIPPNHSIAVQTSGTVSLGSSTTEKVPSKVMSTAVTTLTTSPNSYLYYSWNSDNVSDEFYMYLHLAEIETLKKNQTREVNVYMNGNHLVGPVSAVNHTTSTVFGYFYDLSTYELRMYRTQNSTLPPMFNALERYRAKQLLQSQTEDQDAAAIWSIKSTYGLKENWQGDMCVPQTSVWNGLNCNYNDKGTPRIISMNLSSKGLEGEIAAALANLTMIQSFNLTGNDFTRPLPAGLLEKSKNGLLLLRIEESSDADTASCPMGSCKSNKHNKVIIPVISTCSALFLLLTILAILWIIKRRQTQGRIARDELIESRNQRFTLSEVQKITNNFSSVIGKGGFGTVFHGSIGEKQVAVKMLAESSAQGYKEFQAEVNLLMSVHHKNITSLVGYCDEGNHKGIIYEYLANESLEKHLLDGSPKVLSWEERLQIGYDAAQGLEYMHHGCNPPIVHRDVKCSNILLNDKFQGKLADFGLSRAFTSEGATHVSTVVAGTPGYLDPEYYTTNRLTEKSDVYSFGVVLLNLITSRPAISKDTNIINWVESMVAKGSVENIIDPRLHGQFNINTAEKVVELAMNCVARTSVERPIMNDV
ncbi:hypothetical protein OSB04_004856, partial [Centaurea solstitialis]